MSSYECAWNEMVRPIDGETIALASCRSMHTTTAYANKRGAMMAAVHFELAKCIGLVSHCIRGEVVGAIQHALAVSAKCKARWALRESSRRFTGVLWRSCWTQAASTAERSMCGHPRQCLLVRGPGFIAAVVGVPQPWPVVDQCLTCSS